MVLTETKIDPENCLIDRFGRIHRKLRISVTDRCNIRCKYCMPENPEFYPKNEILSYEELFKLVSISTELGIEKVRLTGGEPLVRSNLNVFIQMLKRETRLKEISLTTNGVLLDRYAKSLFDAGIRKINVSLDTLHRDQFIELTRRDELENVLNGIETALKTGFQIKINSVAMKGINESQIVPLAKYCRKRNIELRFIEFMPLESDQIWTSDQVLSGAEIRGIIRDAGLPLTNQNSSSINSPSSRYQYDDGLGALGTIDSVTDPFCSNCDRLRITSDGKMRACLFSLEETDLKSLMRNNASTADIKSAMKECVLSKWEGHQITNQHYVRPEKAMYQIGG